MARVVTEIYGNCGVFKVTVPVGSFFGLEVRADGYWEVRFELDARTFPAFAGGGAIALDPLVNSNQLPWWRAHIEAMGLPSEKHPVRIGIVDSGCGFHPLLERIVRQKVSLRDFDAFIEDDDFGDSSDEGHGTHLAGIVGAAPSVRCRFSGITRSLVVHTIRVLEDFGTRDVSLRLSSAIDYLTENSFDIINLSLSISSESPDNPGMVSRAIDEAIQAGVFVVAAAGNDGTESLVYPASHPGVVPVSNFGSHQGIPQGPTLRYLDELHGINVAKSLAHRFFPCSSTNSNSGTWWFPGVGIVSTSPQDDISANETFTELTGTSMACAVATGVIARILSGHYEAFSALSPSAKLETMAHQLRKLGVIRGSKILQDKELR